MVVVAAAGNVGKNASGQIQYGGITAPGNAPWVLTVGASSHMGTLTRTDDTVADYSSRGPTAIDYLAKPDLVAPGTGIVSLSDPNSTFYSTKSAFLLDGTRATSYRPYLSLTGTSMATPVVAGSVALMLQANPALTPNAVKAILEYTAENRAGYNRLTEGAGFLNAKGAVDLAQLLPARAARPAVPEGPVVVASDHLGQPRAGRRDDPADRHRLGRQHRVGHHARRGRRQHRLGHGLPRRRRLRQHRLGLVP